MLCSASASIRREIRVGTFAAVAVVTRNTLIFALSYTKENENNKKMPSHRQEHIQTHTNIHAHANKQICHIKATLRIFSYKTNIFSHTYLQIYSYTNSRFIYL